jgi:hypothetical protein
VIRQLEREIFASVQARRVLREEPLRERGSRRHTGSARNAITALGTETQRTNYACGLRGHPTELSGKQVFSIYLSQCEKLMRTDFGKSGHRLGAIRSCGLHGDRNIETPATQVKKLIKMDWYTEQPHPIKEQLETNSLKEEAAGKAGEQPSRGLNRR